MLAQVLAAVTEHDLIRAGDRGAVALSGGADSLCLLHVLGRLARELDLELTALSVDHGLRPGSAEDTARAVALARELGLEAAALKVDLSGEGGSANLQERAREARLALLAGEARRRGCRWVALGHTATDQAETVLMRAVRGAGLQGLAAMAWVRAPFIRPLLGVTGRQTRAYVARHGLEPVVDPTNATDRYLRNRLRRRVLPELERENPAVVQALCRLADGCREDHEALEALAGAELERASRDGGLDVALLGQLHAGILHRVLRLAHAEATGTTRRLTRDHVQRAAGLLASTDGSASLDLPGARLVRRYDQLRWEPPLVTAADRRWAAAVTLSGPGAVTLPDGRTLEVRRCEPGVARDGALDPARAPFPLTVRGPGPGDRVAVGPTMTRKVARLLMDAKIPREDRWRVPLVFCGDDVVMVVGLRVAHGYAAGPGSGGLQVKLS